MKICSISDTHYNLPVIEEAVKIFNSAEAGIIHEGDGNPPCEVCTSKGSLEFSVDGERDTA